MNLKNLNRLFREELESVSMHIDLDLYGLVWDNVCNIITDYKYIYENTTKI